MFLQLFWICFYKQSTFKSFQNQFYFMPKVRRRRSRKPISQIKIAKERIKILFELAEKRAKKGDFDLANRYVELARKIGMRYNVNIPKDLKRKYCKYCYKFLLPGKTSRHRMKNGMLSITCLNCKKTMRYPFKR